MSAACSPSPAALAALPRQQSSRAAPLPDVSFLDDAAPLIAADDAESLMCKNMEVAASVRDASYKYRLSVSFAAGKMELMPIFVGPQSRRVMQKVLRGVDPVVVIGPPVDAPIVATELHVAQHYKYLGRFVGANVGMAKEARYSAAQASSAFCGIPQAMRKALAGRPEHMMLMEALVFSRAFYGGPSPSIPSQACWLPSPRALPAWAPSSARRSGSRRSTGGRSRALGRGR